jgi:uncharacterized membrane protein
MGKLTSLLYGLGVGAGLMYFLDPQSGDRRKALLRDQLNSLRNDANDLVDSGVRDLRNRARGLMAEGMAIVSREEIPPFILEERIRSRLGFLTRHPGSIQVNVSGREVTLDGDVLADEVDRIQDGVTKIRGVDLVHNNLRVHQEAGNIPQLQGRGWLPGDERGSMMWSPSARLLAFGGALYLLLYGLARGGLVGLLAKLGGAVLGARALTNTDLRTMTGQPTGFEAVRVRKAINIQASVDQVYNLWSNFENFPRFMNNVEQIRDLGQGRSHWVVKGPAGSKVEFDAEITEQVPNQVVAWKTLPDSAVTHHGQVRFKENKQGTQVNVQMAYTPPAGVAGHVVAKLFGKDPKSEMNADLMRMKSLLEEGKTTSTNKEVTRQQVMPVTGDDQGEEERRTMGGMGGGPLTSSDL